MSQDKYTAVWVSHTSISDFLKCPKSYFLKNVYRDPKTKHKIKLMSPPLALGSAVHEVLEALSILPTEKRLQVPLVDRLEKVWDKFRGKKGGFLNEETEIRAKERAQAMLRSVTNNPGPIARSAVKIQKDLPYFWLSDEENIILCGKVDWLEYLPATDSVHIIDFKTGKYEENDDSLQLPIYHLLVSESQKRKVTKASYWYLDSQTELTERNLPDLISARAKILKVALDIKLARQLQRFKCSEIDGCRDCEPMQAIVEGRAEFVGNDEYNADVYIAPRAIELEESIIL